MHLVALLKELQKKSRVSIAWNLVETVSPPPSIARSRSETRSCRSAIAEGFAILSRSCYSCFHRTARITIWNTFLAEKEKKSKSPKHIVQSIVQAAASAVLFHFIVFSFDFARFGRTSTGVRQLVFGNIQLLCCKSVYGMTKHVAPLLIQGFTYVGYCQRLNKYLRSI